MSGGVRGMDILEVGTITGTIDIFEAILMVILLFLALPATLYNLRESWGEKEWAIDDPDPSMRRLGVVRYDNARLMFVAIVMIFLGTISAFMVPSVLQLAQPFQLDLTDLLNAVAQRVIYIIVVLCLTYKCINDALWRRDVDRRRKGAPRTSLATVADEAKAVGVRLEEQIAENVALTKQAVASSEKAAEKSEQAETAANAINLKIKGIGESQEVQANRTEEIALDTQQIALDTQERVHQIVPRIVTPQTPQEGDPPHSPLTVGEQIEETHTLAERALGEAQEAQTTAQEAQDTAQETKRQGETP